MRAALLAPGLLAAAVLCTAPGCSWLPTPEMAALADQSRSLTGQNRAALAEIQNLRAHAREVEGQLQTAEAELAALGDQAALDRQQLAVYRSERQELHEQFRGIAQAKTALRPQTLQRLAAISRQFPALKLDPQTGVTKLDTDILFDAGTAEVKPEAVQTLRDLAGFLNAPEAKDLKVLLVGHSEKGLMAARTPRDKQPGDSLLGADRALAVCDRLRRLGLAEARMGVMGVGALGPGAPNVAAAGAESIPRVEVLVMVPEVPVVGWTATSPSLY